MMRVSQKTIRILVLLMIFIFGFYLRKIEMQRPIWLDEVSAVEIAITKSYSNIFQMNHWDTSHPPLFWMWLKWWSSFEINTTWLRIPSVIVSLVGSLFLYLFTKKIIRSEWAALVVTGLWTLNGFIVGLSSQIRPYGFVQLFSFIFLYAFHVVFTTKKVPSYWYVGLTLVSWLGVLTDYSFWWVFLIPHVVALISFHLRRKQLLLILWLWLPIFYWVPFTLNHLPATLALNSYISVSRNVIFEYDHWLQELTGIGNPAIANVLLLIIILGIVSTINGKYPASMKIWKLYMVGFLIVPLISLLISYWLSPIFVARNVFIGYFGLFGLIGILFTGTFRWRTLAVLGCCVYLIQTYSLTQFQRYWYPGTPAEVHTVTSLICAQYPNEPVIIFYHDGKIHESILHAFYQYYFTATDVGCKGLDQVYSYYVPSSFRDYVVVLNKDAIPELSEHSSCLKIPLTLQYTDIYHCSKNI